MSEKPQRKKRPKLKRLNVTAREKWEKILKDVEKQEVPVTVLESISVNLIDGTEVSINIKELLLEGYEPEEVEQMLSERLNSLDHIIRDVDFYVSIDDVAKVVQPITDSFLKDL